MADVEGYVYVDDQPELIKHFLSGELTPSQYLSTTLCQDIGYDADKEQLGYGLKYVEKQLHNEVAHHHSDLMQQVSNLKETDQKLDVIKNGVQTLQTSLKRLKQTIQDPYETVQGRVVQLRNMWETTELLRRLQRFLTLLGKLKEQDAQAKLISGSVAVGGISSTMSMDLPKAAKNLREIVLVLDEVDMTGIDVVDKELDWINLLTRNVKFKAQELLKQGMEQLNQAEVGIALQTFFNLDILPSVVKDVLERQRKDVRATVLKELDSTTINKSIQGVAFDKEDEKASEQSRIRSVMFAKLDLVTSSLHHNLVQIAQLSKVLSKKRDTITHVCFLTAVSSTVGDNFLEEYWTKTSQMFRERLNETTKRGAINQMLVNEYPRLYRLLFNFVANIQDYCVWLTPTNKGGSSDPGTWLAETLSPYEKLFTAASQHRLYERVEQLAVKIQQSCPEGEVAEQPCLPSEKDRQHIGLRAADVRVFVTSITQELTGTRGERALHAPIITNVAKALQLFSIKCESMWLRTSAAAQTTGNATNAQVFNATLYNALVKVGADVEGAVGAQTGPTIGTNPTATFVAGVRSLPSDSEIEAAIAQGMQLLRDNLLDIEHVATGILRPIFSSATKYLEKLVLKIHKEDWQKPDLNRSSSYVLDLENRLQSIRHKVLYLIDGSTGPYERLCCHLATRLLRFFVRNAAFIQPLSEEGKMKLSTDIAQVQFAINIIYSQEKGGAAYKELRAFRSILFMETDQLANSMEVRNAIIHPLNTIHHLFSRTSPPLPLPNIQSQKSLEEYSEELDLLEEQGETQNEGYHAFYHIWEIANETVNAYPDQTDLLDAVGTIGALFWPAEY